MSEAQISEQDKGSQDKSLSFSSSSENESPVIKINTKCQRLTARAKRYSHRRPSYSRQQRKTGQKRTSGWLQEVALEHCGNPQEDAIQNIEIWDDTAGDFHVDHCSRNINITEHRELSVKEAEGRETRYSVYASLPKQGEKYCYRGSKKHDPSSNYHPLEVWQEHTSRTYPVDHERTIINERKTILYGQTPPAMCKIQLSSMAEAVGVTVVEFARHVVATKTKEHVQLLRQFYTPYLPQLTQLFDELDICAVTKSPLQQTVRGRQAIDAGKKTPNDETSIVDEAGARPSKDAIPDEKTNTENEGKIAENLTVNYKKCSRTEQKKNFTQMSTLNSNSRKDVLMEMNFVLAEDTQKAIKENITGEEFKCAGKKSRDRSEATSSNLTQRNRIFVPNQKNDTYGTSEKYSDLLDNDYITCSSLEWEKQPTRSVNTPKKVKFQCSKNSLIPTRVCDSSEMHSLLTEANKMLSSTSACCQEAKAREKRCADLTCGVIGSLTGHQNITPQMSSEQNSKMGSSDYNTLLAGLLFKDEMTTYVDKTKCFKNQVLRNNSKDEIYDLDYIPSDKTESCKDDREMNSKATGYYNKVLDTILFGECSSVPESVPEQSGMAATLTSPTQLTIASSQPNHSYNPSSHSRHIIAELFDSPHEEMTGGCQGKATQILSATSDVHKSLPAS